METPKRGRKQFPFLYNSELGRFPIGVNSLTKLLDGVRREIAKN